MSLPESFPGYLSTKLRVGTTLRVYHISTPPTSSSALFAAPPGQQEEPTTSQSHFLGITQHFGDGDDEVLVLGIEVLVFVTSTLTTIFVSKADSTGLLTRQIQTGQGQSVAQTVITSFLEFLLIQHASSGKRLVLSLFARSQNQYLFPGSIENTTKHVLDDRQLIKWWCRVLEPLAEGRSEVRNVAAKAYVVVPGCDKSETRAFYPASARNTAASESKWQNRYPVELLVTDSTASVRSLIPRFPDDPKARFCTDLDGDHVEADGKWRGIRSLDQFWEMMSYRQECSAGRLVGFVWIVFSRPDPLQQPLPSPPPSQIVTTDTEEPRQPELASPSAERSVEHFQKQEASRMHNGLQMSADNIAKTDAKANVSASSATASMAVANDQALHDQDIEKPASQANGAPSDPGSVAIVGHILMSNDAYQQLNTLLLDQLDFAGLETAQKSTSRWIEMIKDLTQAMSVGSDVHGRLATTASAIQPESVPQAAATTLIGVRKKRKIDVSHATELQNESQAPTNGVNTLSSGLIRKKAKPA